MHIRKDDTVQVITGDDAPATGRVLRVLPDAGKVVVEGINRVYRHMRPSRRNQQGGRLSKEMPINASNVLLFCANCRKGVRIGKREGPEGRKERFCKACGNGLGFVGKAKKK
ncbi:MAG: 50S ribosomal protein L24 [Gemmataceae bacterium]|nr:50S ribosomal protein L24 [Gemmataceae bacterium]